MKPMPPGCNCRCLPLLGLNLRKHDTLGVHLWYDLHGGVIRAIAYDAKNEDALYLAAPTGLKSGGDPLFITDRLNLYKIDFDGQETWSTQWWNANDVVVDDNGDVIVSSTGYGTLTTPIIDGVTGSQGDIFPQMPWRLTPYYPVTAGTWQLQIGLASGGPLHLTVPLNWDATAAEVQTAVDANPIVVGGTIVIGGGPWPLDYLTFHDLTASVGAVIPGQWTPGHYRYSIPNPFGVAASNLITGTLTEPSSLHKYNSLGVLQWRIVAADDISAITVQEGSTDIYAVTLTNALHKYDTDGNLQWSRTPSGDIPWGQIPISTQNNVFIETGGSFPLSLHDVAVNNSGVYTTGLIRVKTIGPSSAVTTRKWSHDGELLADVDRGSHTFAITTGIDDEIYVAGDEAVGHNITRFDSDLGLQWTAFTGLTVNALAFDTAVPQSLYSGGSSPATKTGVIYTDPGPGVPDWPDWDTVMYTYYIFGDIYTAGTYTLTVPFPPDSLQRQTTNPLPFDATPEDIILELRELEHVGIGSDGFNNVEVYEPTTVTFGPWPPPKHVLLGIDDELDLLKLRFGFSVVFRLRKFRIGVNWHGLSVNATGLISCSRSTWKHDPDGEWIWRTPFDIPTYGFPNHTHPVNAVEVGDSGHVYTGSSSFKISIPPTTTRGVP